MSDFTKTPKSTDITNEGVPGSSTDHEGLLTADAAQTACDSVTTISDHPNVNKYACGLWSLTVLIYWLFNYVVVVCIDYRIGLNSI